jgi:hypothetical protein
LLKVRPDFGDVLPDDVPYNLQIDDVVAVDDAIAHVRDAAPWYFRIALPDFIGDAPGCLTNDLQGPDHREVDAKIGLELLESNPVSRISALFMASRLSST